MSLSLSGSSATLSPAMRKVLVIARPAAGVKPWPEHMGRPSARRFWVKILRKENT